MFPRLRMHDRRTRPNRRNGLWITALSSSTNPRYHPLLVLQNAHDHLQCQIGTIGPCYIMACARGTQEEIDFTIYIETTMEFAIVRYLRRFEFGGTDSSTTGSVSGEVTYTSGAMR